VVALNSHARVHTAAAQPDSTAAGLHQVITVAAESNMAKRTVTRQRIAQINLGGHVLSEADRRRPQNIANAAEADGVALAKKCQWDGYLILIAAGAALEDANFHSEAAIVRQMAEKLSNPTTNVYA
jgi:hypothetical protein